MPTLKRVSRPSVGRPTKSPTESRGGNADTQFYRQARWGKLRTSILSAEPLCRHCKAKGDLTAATEVDHIVPVKQGGEIYDTDNLQPLCGKCHARKSTKDKWRKLTK